MRLDIYNLGKRYNDFFLNIKDFHTEDSEIIGIVGNNGAGKTTFLKLVLDLILPETGEVYSNGVRITLSEHWKEYTGSFLDEDFLIQFLTPIEFFRFIGGIYNIPDDLLKTRLISFSNFLNFDIDKKKYIREYSTGNKYKIGIVSTLITNPKVVIFDEPFNYLDPKSQNQLVEIFKNYNSFEKALILLSSHDLSHLTELCSRIILIENGVFIKDIENLNQANTYEELKEYFTI
ncbi:MAG TPA: ABC transporter ATP-binding protein [Bacteroidales bacterium]|nr:ABC transporter ATP-binding protein [Bacteroidales bacterium]